MENKLPENLDDPNHCPICGYVHEGDYCPSGEQNRRQLNCKYVGPES